MISEYPQPHAQPHAQPPGRVSLATVRSRVAAPRGMGLRVRSLFVGCGTLGLFLAAGRCGAYSALRSLSTLRVLDGSALHKAIQAVPTAQRGEVTDGA